MATKEIMLILGLESSCDETAAAVFDGAKILSDVVASQNDIHHKYGGIVPELASRRHMEAILPVVNEALQKSAARLGEINGVAVTQGPGLVGALLVGISFAKALSYSNNVPLVGVNHIEGHLTAISIEKEVAYPYLGLIVSGGHTSLYMVNGIGRYRHIGSTRDDAAGEALDKGGKLLGLGYPAGPVIDRLARNGDRHAFKFPKAQIHDGQFDFSFSGLKTSLVNMIGREGKGFAEKRLNDIAASYQEAVVEMLTEKTLKAAHHFDISTVVISGGVAANSRLREHLAVEAGKAGVKYIYPSIPLCTDNASMIAHLGYRYLEMGKSSPLDINGIPDWPIREV